jgi:hypothetical protein
MQLLDDLKEMRGYWKLKQEALDRSVGVICFGRGCGPVVTLRNESVSKKKYTVYRYFNTLMSVQNIYSPSNLSLLLKFML